MELEALDGDRFRLSVEGLEWDALHVPMVRTNDRSYPRRHPRHGWSQWPANASPGRSEVIALIRRIDYEDSFPTGAVRLVIDRKHIPGVLEVLRQNRRVEWHLPLVPRELVAQMIAAIEAFAAGRPLPSVETERITRAYDDLQWRQWGQTEWTVSAYRLSKRRARITAFILKVMRVGDFFATDPRQRYDMRLDYTTTLRLRAALQESGSQTVMDYRDGRLIAISPAQARDEMRESLDIDDFLDHAETPGPEEFD